MERNALKQLIEWKSRQNRKPLIIHGARQTGKTWLMKEFGRLSYKNTVYVNFERNARIREAFAKDIAPQRLLLVLEAENNTKIIPGECLIIFDEIQAQPMAITSLKYFYEEMPQLNIVCAGSLLGVALHNGVSYPVGKTETMALRPMSFREFLMAMGEEKLCGLLSSNDYDLIGIFKTKLLDLLKQYMFVGGMPEAVAEFTQNRDIPAVRRIQKNILNDYKSDFSKHIPHNLLAKTSLLWDSIPAQLSKENKKFVYKEVIPNSRAKDFEDCISWLEQSGLIYKICRISKPCLPLSAYRKDNIFKIFMSDIGLLACMSGVEPNVIIDGDRLFTEFKGALAEQFVLQELKTIEYADVYYWANDKTNVSEVDFLIQHKGRIIPAEAKAGINLKAKSLKSYIGQFQPEVAMRFSAADYKRTGNLYDIPLFLCGEFPVHINRQEKASLPKPD